MVMCIICICITTDYIYFVVCHLIGQRKVTIKTFFIVGLFIYNGERTILLRLLLNRKMPLVYKETINSDSDISAMEITLSP